MVIKKFSFVIPALLLLTSCHFYQPSEIERELQKTRGSKKTPALAGARNLLLKHGLAHKIVYFRYDVSARPLTSVQSDREFFTRRNSLRWPSPRSVQRERVGIIYRANPDRTDRWWYFDAELRRPIWLPTDTVEKQVGFAMRCPVELFRVQEFESEVAGVSKVAMSAMPEGDQSSWNAKFKRMHETDFDPSSPMDQAKMRALRGQ